MKERGYFGAIVAGVLLFFFVIAYYWKGIATSASIFCGVIQDITNIYGFYPWDFHTKRMLMLGHFPLWNPHNAFGVPHLANMQSGVFYPLNWLKFFFNYWMVVDFVLVLRLWLAGFFLFLFFRKEFNAGFLPSLFAGTSFCLGGYFSRYVYMSHLNIECLVPFLLWSYSVVKDSTSRGSFILAVFAVYLCIAGGFPEASLWALTLTGVYFIFAWLRKGKKLGWGLVILITSFLLGFIVSSIQWLGFAEYLSLGFSYHQDGDGLKHLDPRYSISIILPWFFGDNSLSTLVPFLCPSAGLITILFSFVVIFEPKKKELWFWIFVLLFSLAMVYGLKPLNFIGYVYPFSVTYNYKYCQPILLLSFSILSGAGLERFLNEKENNKLLIAIVVIFCFAIINLFIALLDGFEPYYGFGAVREMLKLGVVLMALILVLSIKVRGYFFRAFSIFMVSLISGYVDFLGNSPVDRKGFLVEQLKELALLKNLLREPFRLSAEGDIFFPNLLMVAGVDDLRDYEPVYPLTYVYYMSAINGLDTKEKMRTHYDMNMLFQVDRENVDSPLTSLANLVFYASEFELSSQPLFKLFLKNNNQKGKLKWVRELVVSLGEKTQRSIVQHSPGSLSAHLNLSNERMQKLKFDIGLMPGKLDSYPPDGAGFIVVAEQAERKSLLYARHLNPSLREKEKNWVGVELDAWSISGTFALHLVAHPGYLGNLNYDYLVWGGLRITGANSWGKNWEEFVPAESGFGIYKQKALPRAFLVWATSNLNKANLEEELRAFSRLSSVNFNFFSRYVVSSVPIQYKVDPGPPLDIQPEVRFDLYEPERVVMSVSNPKAGFLVFSDQYFPGWHCGIDGKEARIYRVDLAFRGLFVPAGKHKIVFYYRPYSFRVGLWLFISCILSLVLLALVFPRISTKRGIEDESKLS